MYFKGSRESLLSANGDRIKWCSLKWSLITGLSAGSFREDSLGLKVVAGRNQTCSGVLSPSQEQPLSFSVKLSPVPGRPHPGNISIPLFRSSPAGPASGPGRTLA